MVKSQYFYQNLGLTPLENANFVDCSQSPIFPCDRRDRARLTINGGHLDFYMYRGGGRRGL